MVQSSTMYNLWLRSTEEGWVTFSFEATIGSHIPRNARVAYSLRRQHLWTVFKSYCGRRQPIGLENGNLISQILSESKKRVGGEDSLPLIAYKNSVRQPARHQTIIISERFGRGRVYLRLMVCELRSGHKSSKRCDLPRVGGGLDPPLCTVQLSVSTL